MPNGATSLPARSPSCGYVWETERGSGRPLCTGCGNRGVSPADQRRVSSASTVASAPSAHSRSVREGLSGRDVRANDSWAQDRPVVPPPVAGAQRLLHRWATTLWWLTFVAATAAGLTERLWYVFHRPITSDEAISGLMATQALHGHFFAFYWGQVYGGTLETLVEAPILALFGHSAVTLSLIPVGLEAIAALLVWRIATHLTGGRWIPVLAASVAWVGPQLAVSETSYETGFRGVVMVSGLTLVLVAVRIARGRRYIGEFAVFGAAAGVGWWSSPEIVYFALPAGAILVESIVRDWHHQEIRRWLQHLGACVEAAVIGALPWLWVNGTKGFISLRMSSWHPAPGIPTTGYVGRLALFWKYTVPMLFNLRAENSGAWLVGSVLHYMLLIGLLGLFAVGVVVGTLNGGPRRAITLAAVAYPFLMCVIPGAWYWQDGRYAVLETPLLALVAAIGFTEFARRVGGRAGQRPRSYLPIAGVALGVFLCGWAGLSIWNEARFAVSPPGTSWWSDPEGPTYRAVDTLTRAGVRNGYADYWVAYDLDFLSGQQLHFTVTNGDSVRWVAENEAVRKSHEVTWLFMPVGPGDISERTFDAFLRRAGIPFRTVHTSIVDAVVLHQQLTPETVLGAGSNP